MTGENQPLTDVTQLGADEHAMAQNRRALSLGEFKNAVRTRMSEQRARPNTP